MASKIILTVILSLVLALYVVSTYDHKKLDEKTLLGMTAKHIATVSDQVSNSTIAKHEVTRKIVDNVNNAANTVQGHVKTHGSYLWTKLNSDMDFHKKIDESMNHVETKAGEAKEKVLRALSTLLKGTDGVKETMNNALDSTTETLKQTSAYIGELSGNAVEGVKNLGSSSLSNLAASAKEMPANAWNKLNDQKFHTEVNDQVQQYYNIMAKHAENVWNHDHVKTVRDTTHKVSSDTVESLKGHVANLMTKISAKKD